jgi:serine/threonine protein kinase/Flp pilus assembly protein TadD
VDDESTLSMSLQEVHRAAQTVGTWGPFRLIEKVGQGSFGEVYRAFDSKLEREVALKLLLPRGMDQDAEERALLREARAIARVRHPNVVSVYGVDTHDGRVGFWSDFVNGKTLSVVLTADGPFGAREAALIGVDVCKAVSAVHAAGLLHRDIKSGNVMRESGGRILLMDFGLTHDVQASFHYGGTPPYMAPELLAGQTPSIATDIYAIGVLLFHLVSQKYPVKGKTKEDFVEAHQSGSRLSLMDLRPDLPEPFARVIETAMHSSPEQRHKSAGQLIMALSDAMGLGPVSTPEPVAVRRPRFWPWAAVGVAAVGLVAYELPSRNGSPGLTAAANEDYFKAQDLLEHYYKPGNIAKSVELFQKVVKRDPNFALGQAGLGGALWWQYRNTNDASLIEPARAASNRALALDRDIASVHVTLGEMHTNAGHTDLAAQELREALRLDARNAQAFGALAELYQKQGRDAEVEPTIRKAVDLAPGQWRYLNQLGLLRLSAGQYAEAAEAFQEGARLNPDNARAFNNLGTAYLRQARFPEAQAALEKAIALEPEYRRYSNLGIVFQRQGKFTEAAAMYQRAIDMDPAQHLATGNLASALEASGDKRGARQAFLKAVQLAEDARKNNPKDPALLSSLGSYYVAAGMPDQGMPLLRQAMALAPSDPQILFTLAEAHEMLGEREDALHWIREAFQRGYPKANLTRDPKLAGLLADPRLEKPGKSTR